MRRLIVVMLVLSLASVTYGQPNPPVTQGYFTSNGQVLQVPGSWWVDKSTSPYGYSTSAQIGAVNQSTGNFATVWSGLKWTGGALATLGRIMGRIGYWAGSAYWTAMLVSWGWSYVNGVLSKPAGSYVAAPGALGVGTYHAVIDGYGSTADVYLYPDIASATAAFSAANYGSNYNYPVSWPWNGGGWNSTYWGFYTYYGNVSCGAQCRHQYYYGCPTTGGHQQVVQGTAPVSDPDIEAKILQAINANDANVSNYLEQISTCLNAMVSNANASWPGIVPDANGYLFPLNPAWGTLSASDGAAVQAAYNAAVSDAAKAALAAATGQPQPGPTPGANNLPNPYPVTVTNSPTVHVVGAEVTAAVTASNVAADAKQVTDFGSSPSQNATITTPGGAPGSTAYDSYKSDLGSYLANTVNSIMALPFISRVQTAAITTSGATSILSMSMPFGMDNLNFDFSAFQTQIETMGNVIYSVTIVSGLLMIFL